MTDLSFHIKHCRFLNKTHKQNRCKLHMTLICLLTYSAVCLVFFLYLNLLFLVLQPLLSTEKTHFFIHSVSNFKQVFMCSFWKCLVFFCKLSCMPLKKFALFEV